MVALKYIKNQKKRGMSKLILGRKNKLKRKVIREAAVRYSAVDSCIKTFFETTCLTPRKTAENNIKIIHSIFKPCQKNLPSLSEQYSPEPY